MSILNTLYNLSIPHTVLTVEEFRSLAFTAGYNETHATIEDLMASNITIKWVDPTECEHCTEIK